MTVRKRSVNPIVLLTSVRKCRATNHTRLLLPDTALPMNRLGGLYAEKRAADKVDGKELAGIALPERGDIELLIGA
jgi:hypothetical protein